jgi:hypothetical protein
LAGKSGDDFTHCFVMPGGQILGCHQDIVVDRNGYTHRLP